MTNRSRFAPFLAIPALLAAVLAGAACTGDSGSKQAQFGDTECAVCIQTACDTEIATCNGETDCADALECILDCPAVDNGLDLDCAGDDCAALITTSAGGAALDDLTDCYLFQSSASGTCDSQCAPPTE